MRQCSTHVVVNLAHAHEEKSAGRCSSLLRVMNNVDNDNCCESGDMDMPPIQSVEDFWGQSTFERTFSFSS